jgi:response regulator RpfG family c-di-GMP phosphodiesterase
MSKLRVLFIDDEPNVLRSIQRLFRLEAFQVDTAHTPQEALDYAAAHECAVFVSDQRMPLMEGTTLLSLLRERRPDAIRMTLTGYADKEAAIEAINRGHVAKFLTKPWQDDELVTEVRLAVEHYKTKQENQRLQLLAQQQNAELLALNSSLEARVAQRTEDVTRLNQSLKASFLSSIALMAQLGELHSPTVGSHSQRVATLAKEVALALKRPADEVTTIYAAALLHDIGKVGLPESLLQKNPALLTEAERNHLRQHPIAGERLVSLVPALATAASLVRSHHERWNGTGYPDRLTHAAIPLGARVIAVVNHYDNLLNDRSHFENATRLKSLQATSKMAGTWFDPDVVSALSEVIRQHESQDQGPTTVEILLKDLRAGMQLAAPLLTVRGVMLLPADSVLSEGIIDRVLAFHHSDPINGSILVYRQKTPEVKGTSPLPTTSAVTIA